MLACHELRTLLSFGRSIVGLSNDLFYMSLGVDTLDRWYKSWILGSSLYWNRVFQTLLYLLFL